MWALPPILEADQAFPCRTMAATYEIAQLRGVALHPAQLLWLATYGSARALHLDIRLAISRQEWPRIWWFWVASTPAIAQRSACAEDIWEEIFPTIMMSDDRAIAATYVAGQRVWGHLTRQFRASLFMPIV